MILLSIVSTEGPSPKIACTGRDLTTSTEACRVSIRLVLTPATYCHLLPVVKLDTSLLLRHRQLEQKHHAQSGVKFMHSGPIDSASKRQLAQPTHPVALPNGLDHVSNGVRTMRVVRSSPSAMQYERSGFLVSSQERSIRWRA